MIREINKLLEKVLLDGNKKCVLVEWVLDSIILEVIYSMFILK
ncbi:hypothetical protein QES_3415 [Clostridioides difficile CD149]|uniref:Uncharacterized protein n=1 Tax=Clostridioides difficile ATCC 9689 = DSM 1296 TaxID=1121308 RepID=A0AC59G350_CLODI|nr:hypothetical protein [Clostridioides difficile]AKP44072.1 hypothetical protein CDIF1296T_03255 [Clostridioides difficile ATCC 9689 = DSM 1296]AXU88103.1 hypothetical protein CDIF29745_03332 [Clostridioides difficile]EQE38590.1 hypothetical protein QCA_3226 [Clostridioides difficile CD40]EQE52184.1 hypothetical protein QCG_3412 [Clostridioides difficile CD43]EQE67473.1 hypothetical protein QCO_3189 [Clostridioides difficile CD47]